jgi:O-antigen ligase
MWILLGIIAIAPMELHPYLYLSEDFLGIFPDFTVVKVLGLVGIAWTAGLVLAGTRRVGVLDSPQGKAFLLFLAVALVSGLAGEAPLLPVLVTKWLSIAFFLPLVLAAVRTSRNLQTVVKVGAAVPVLLYPYALRVAHAYGDGRLGDGFNEPNFYAAELILLVPLALALTTGERSAWPRRFWLAAALVLVCEVVQTGSRGGLIGIVVVGTLILVRLVKHRKRALLGMLLAIVALVVAVGDVLQDRVLASLQMGGIDSGVRDYATEMSTELRIALVRAGAHMILSHPLGGVGLGNFKPMSGTYDFVTMSKTAHHMYVEIAAELGLPALLAFLAVLVLTLRSLRRSRKLAAARGLARIERVAAAVEIGLTGFLVTAVFLSAEYDKLMWLLVFLSIALERIVRAEAARAPEGRAAPPSRRAARVTA